MTRALAAVLVAVFLLSGADYILSVDGRLASFT